MFKSDKRLYLTPDDQVSAEPVTGGRLLVGEGCELPNEVAERYGLLESKPLRVVESKPVPTRSGKKKGEPAAEPPAEPGGETESPADAEGSSQE